MVARRRRRDDRARAAHRQQVATAGPDRATGRNSPPARQRPADRCTGRDRPALAGAVRADQRPARDVTAARRRMGAGDRTRWGRTCSRELVGVSVSSVRRYAAGTRATPQDIAERLHFLALLIADLAGSYNDFGIRRWLNRPRTPLGGRSPASLLGEFDPEGPDAAAVATLAAALVGAGSA